MITNSNILSIDIGSGYIKLVEGKYFKNKIVIYKTCKAKTPVGAFNDGNILDVEGIAGEIAILIKENEIKAINVVFMIQSSNMIMRRFVVPNAKKNEMKEIIKIELEEETSLSLEEYIVEYQRIGKVEDHKIEVVAFALSGKLVDEYIRLLKILKLRPYVLDVQVNNIAGLYKKGLKIDDENIDSSEAVAFIDLGENSTSVVIMKDHKVEFSRIVALGGLDIDKALSEKYGLSLKEAEKIKVALSRSEEKGESVQEKEQLEMLRFIKKNVKDLAEEVSRIMSYYVRVKSDNVVDRIYLAGSSSRFGEFEKTMYEETGVKTYRVNQLNDFVVADGRNLGEAHEYINAMIAIRKR